VSDSPTEAGSSQAAPTEPTGRYDKGPVTIKWWVPLPSPAPDGACKVELWFESAKVASNTMSPGDTNWDTGRHEASHSWCEASFELQVATPGQEGQLDLKSLTWCQEPGGTNHTTNQLLGTWPYSG